MTTPDPLAQAKRRPEPVRPPRIAALPNLPVFHKLDGRRVLVAGGGAGAVWKAELAAAAGADVLVAAGSADAADSFAGLAADPPAGRVTVAPRLWVAADLEDAALAFGDFADGAEAARFAAAALMRGVPVNLIDRPDLCDFQVGTIVNRAPVVLAISTDGAAPMLGQSIRARIESVLPLGLSDWARAAQDWRPRVKARFADFADRRRFWERFTRLAWDKVDRAPTAHDRDDLFDGVSRERSQGRSPWSAPVPATPSCSP